MTAPEEDGYPNWNRAELPLRDHRGLETGQPIPETTWKTAGRRWLNELRYIGACQMTPTLIWLSLAGGLLGAILVMLAVVLLAHHWEPLRVPLR
jgi:hypothetical protein